MSGLRPQSEPNQTLIRSLSPIAIFMSARPNLPAGPSLACRSAIQVRLRNAHTEPFVEQANALLPIIRGGLDAPVVKPFIILAEGGIVRAIWQVAVHLDLGHFVHAPFAQVLGDADIAHAIDDDFTVDLQEAMRGVGIFCIGWLTNRHMLYFDFDALIGGERRRCREQGRQNDCAISHVLHYAHTARALRVSASRKSEF